MHPSAEPLQSEDGKFEEVGEAAGIVNFSRARGAALTDFNLDGLIDLIIVNRWDRARLWRNTSDPAGHWLQVKLHQGGPNPDAIGAWIEVRCGPSVMRREIVAGGGHASGQNGWWHFGLGAEIQAEVRVLWPDGSASEWQRIDGDHFYLVERDKAARLWRWAAFLSGRGQYAKSLTKLVKDLNAALKRVKPEIRSQSGAKRIAPHTIVCIRTGATPNVSAMISAAPLITRG